MPPRRWLEPRQGILRWLLPCVCVALTPKCVMCVLAYAGAGAALGLGGSEICGAAADASGAWESWLPLPLAVLVFRSTHTRFGREKRSP